jgi:sec-independent protein translocase protein TatA
MGSLGIPELVIILIIVLLIFGGKKIPELARGLGSGIRHFKEALHEGQQDKQDKKDKESKGD